MIRAITMTTLLTLTDALLRENTSTVVKQFYVKMISSSNSVDKNDPFKDAAGFKLSLIGGDAGKLFRIMWWDAEGETFDEMCIERSDKFILRRCVFKDPAGPSLASRMAKSVKNGFAGLKKRFKKQRGTDEQGQALLAEAQLTAAPENIFQSYEIVLQSDFFQNRVQQSAGRFIFQIQTNTEDFETAFKKLLNDKEVANDGDKVEEKKSFLKSVDYWCTNTIVNTFRIGEYSNRRVKDEQESNQGPNFVKQVGKRSKTAKKGKRSKHSNSGPDMVDATIAAGQITVDVGEDICAICL